MFLAPSCSDLGESLLKTTLLGIPLGEPDGKTPTGIEVDRAKIKIIEKLPAPINVKGIRSPWRAHRFTLQWYGTPTLSLLVLLTRCEQTPPYKLDRDPLNFQGDLTTSVTTTIFYGPWNYMINWLNRPLDQLIQQSPPNSKAHVHFHYCLIYRVSMETWLRLNIHLEHKLHLATTEQWTMPWIVSLVRTSFTYILDRSRAANCFPFVWSI